MCTIGRAVAPRSSFGISARGANLDGYRDLSDGVHQDFARAHEAEMKAFLGFGAITIVCAEGSRRIEAGEPDRILPAGRFEKWKAQHDGARKAKGRLLLLGWKDVDVGRLPRSASMPTTEGIMASLQIIASKKGAGAQQRLEECVRKERAVQASDTPLPEYHENFQVFRKITSASWGRSSTGSPPARHGGARR